MFKKSMILAGLLISTTFAADPATATESGNTLAVSEVVTQGSTQPEPTWEPRRCGSLHPISLSVSTNQPAKQDVPQEKGTWIPRRCGRLNSISFSVSTNQPAKPDVPQEKGTPQ